MVAHRQSGFILLEWVLAALLATLLAVWGSQVLVNKVNDASAQAHATWMLSLKSSVQGYVERYAQQLKQAEDGVASAIAGYADWASPSIVELKADGLLATGFPEQAKPGGGATVRLIRQGACPGDSCRLEALIHSNMPFLKKDSGRVDEQMVAQWLIASKGWGGWVNGNRPDVLAGSAFEYANPPWPGSPLPAGTVVQALTTEQLHKLDFLRVGDTRDPEFQGAASVQGSIQTGADLHVSRYLYLNQAEHAQQACTDEGSISREERAGLLICQNHQWQPLQRRNAGGFSTNDLYGCQNNFGSSTANPVTGSCSCPLFSAIVQISDSGPQKPPDGRTLGFLCVD